MTECPENLRDEDVRPVGMELDLREWLIVVVVVTLVVWIMPASLSRHEGFDPSVGYRVPYAWSEDYWHFEQWCETAKSTHDVLVLGDSVVWGEYVAPGRSLASHLSRVHEDTSFANLGLDGIHPAALAGLLEHHGDSITDARVILHCNLLWMSSPKRDLSGHEEFRFHHARLVPQLTTRIPCYRADASERIGIALERRVEFWNWVRHVRITRFDSQDLHRWTLTHPRLSEGLLRFRFTDPLTEPVFEPRHTSVPWTRRRIRVRDLDWVTAAESYQWRQFRRCVEILRSRGNRLLVVVGPFNEHLLGETGLSRHRALATEVEAWLENAAVDFVSPAVLPSEMYADASHPLEEGYALLAESIPFE